MATSGEWLRALADVGGHLETSTAAMSLGDPGIISGLATVALCLSAILLALDASRRTLAVPSWSYLRHAVAELAAERDGARRVIKTLRAQSETLGQQVDALKSEESRLAGVTARRKEQEAALARLAERLAQLGADKAQVDALSAQIHELEPVHGALVRGVGQLEHRRDELAAAIESRAKQLADLDQLVEDRSASRESIATQLASSRAELDGISRQLDLARAELRSAEKECQHRTELADAQVRERERLEGATTALQAHMEHLVNQTQKLDNEVAAARSCSIKLSESNGRLEADRAALWVEYVALQEKKNAAVAESAAAQALSAHCKQQRDLLQKEVDVLKRVLASSHSTA